MNLFPQSLRFRIILVFSGYSLLLGSLIVAAIFAATRIAEEQALEKRLSLAAEYYLRSQTAFHAGPLSSGQDVPIPSSPYMTSYHGEELLPQWAKSQLTDLPPGEYVRKNDKQRYHIAIRELPDEERFYLIYNVTTINTNHELTAKLRNTLLVTLLPVGLFGLTLGLITARKSISPMLRLSEAVKKAEEDGVLPEDLSRGYHEDEVGHLARTLDHALHEMEAAMEREKAFARDASHELRTPVTTIKGALELLQKSPMAEAEREERLLGRITRATLMMENLIQSLLWLSRQQKEDALGECCPIEVIREVVESHEYLRAAKPVDIRVEEHATPRFPIAAPIFTILVGNLLRNALSYTQQGVITIEIHPHCISVADTGPGIPEEKLQQICRPDGRFHAEGFGFGLSIVRRLCEHLDWSMTIHSVPGEGTRVKICSCIYQPDEGNCPQTCLRNTT